MSAMGSTVVASSSDPSDDKVLKTEKQNSALESVSNSNGDSAPCETEIESTCSCKCGCKNRLEKIENEIDDLRNWKARRQQLDDILSQWKDEVETWMQSTFGFTFSGTLPPSPKQSDNEIDQGKSSSSQSVKDATTVNNGEVEVEVEGEDPGEVELNLDADTEDVEITPDLFGHFLLDNEYDYGESDNDKIENNNESLDDEEEDEVPNDISTKPNKRRRNNNDDSESECYTISSSSDTDDDYTSDEEYEPLRKRGRGRGRGVIQTQSNKYVSKIPSAGSSHGSSTSVMKAVNDESRQELLKHCRKLQGNIWECTVCGFMLTSFENMLLHIKYNHSSTTHTCPYCRIVVLCRSPKDAIMHQSQCKMKTQPAVNNCTKVPEPKVVSPIQTKEISTSVHNIKKPKSYKDANAEADKFVDDILGPGSSAKSKSTLTNNMKKTDTEPAIVTLSSDEDD